MSRFDYIAYDATAQIQQSTVKERVIGLEGFIQAELNPSRTTALALTKLEEVYMWIGKAIRDDQLLRDQSTKLQEERGNS